MGMLKGTLFDRATGRFLAHVSGSNRATLEHHVTATIGIVPGHRDMDGTMLDIAARRTVPLVPELAELKAGAWAEVKRRRAKAEGRGAQSSLGPVATDEGSLMRMGLLAQAGFVGPFTLADNRVRQLGAGEIDCLFAVAMQHVAACHAHSQALRARIDAATTAADLAAIDLAAGWPT